MLEKFCLSHCLLVQLEVPKELISVSELEVLKLQRRPSFIPPTPELNVTKVHDEETGITQLRLSNGIPINYKVWVKFPSTESSLVLDCKHIIC